MASIQLSLKQHHVTVSPYEDKRMILCPGPVRCGKTSSLIPAFLMYSLDFHDKDFLIAGKTMSQVNGFIYREIETWCDAWGLNINRVANQKHTRVGYNRFHFYEALNERSHEKIMGMTLQGAYLDEIAVLPRVFFDEAFARCSEPRARILASCNPEGPYHWVKTKLIDEEDRLSLRVIPFEMRDNPSLTESYISDLAATLQGVSLRRRIYGEWAAASGLVWPIHYIAPRPPQEPYTYDLAIDHANSSVTYAMLIADYGEQMFVADEWRYESQEPTSDTMIATGLLNWLGNRKVRHIIVDPAAAGFRAELRDRMGRYIHPANNDVADGIQATGALLAKKFMMIDPSCVHLRRGIGSWAWDPKAADRGVDKPIKIDDHECDALRYACITFAERQRHDI